MDYNQLKATSLVNPAGGNIFKGEMPYITTNQISNYIYSMRSKGVGTTDNILVNYFGYHRATASCKLLEYLNYGSGNQHACDDRNDRGWKLSAADQPENIVGRAV